jgi:hypothetical protein
MVYERNRDYGKSRIKATENCLIPEAAGRKIRTLLAQNEIFTEMLLTRNIESLT